MATYRNSRNLEASMLDFLTDELDSSWNDVSVVKTFKRAYDTELPVICVRIGRTSYSRVEIGGTNYLREALLLIDIFCTSDGQRLDLKDWIIATLKDGLPYYEYTTTRSGRTTTVTDKTQNGRIIIKSIEDSPINADIGRDKVDNYEKFRHLVTATISLGRVE